MDDDAVPVVVVLLADVVRAVESEVDVREVESVLEVVLPVDVVLLRQFLDTETPLPPDDTGSAALQLPWAEAPV